MTVRFARQLVIVQLEALKTAQRVVGKLETKYTTKHQNYNLWHYKNRIIIRDYCLLICEHDRINAYIVQGQQINFIPKQKSAKVPTRSTELAYEKNPEVPRICDTS